MANSPADLHNLLSNPTESLDLEVKQWIDPKVPDGIAKIARACLALRNNNGGRLIVGICNNGAPDSINVPVDVRSTFHSDIIQAIVSRFAAESFPIDVQFGELGGQIYPVIVVPSGVRTPVASKADLLDVAGSKPLVRDHAVYVRSLNSNNIVSSTEAKRGDWDRLTRICFDNREADIGAFVRRHLSTVKLDGIGALLRSVVTLEVPPPSAENRTREILAQGRMRFDIVTQGRGLKVPPMGFRESAVLIDGKVPPFIANVDFIQRLQVMKPKHTGWTPWVDSRYAGNELDRPFVFDGAWEDLIATGIVSQPHLDFWRMDPRGLFYHLRGLEDDLSGGNKPPPRTQLDFLLQISRVAEVISIGLSFARSMGCDESVTTVVFGFRWSNLAGRELASWVEPMRMFTSLSLAHQDEITSIVRVPLETPLSGIPPHVEGAVRELFALFGGMRFESSVIADIASATLKRRL